MRLSSPAPPPSAAGGGSGSGSGGGATQPLLLPLPSTKAPPPVASGPWSGQHELMGARAVFAALVARRRKVAASAGKSSPAATTGTSTPTKPWGAKAWRAQATAAAAEGPQFAGSGAPRPPPPLDPAFIPAETGAAAAAAQAAAAWTARLDERPTLPRLTSLGCLALAAAAAALAGRATAAALAHAPPPGLTILRVPAAAWLAALIAGVAAGLSARAAALEAALAARAAAAADLADPDSRWAAVGGLAVHYKAARPPGAPPPPAVPRAALALYHGFGAGAFSWAFVHRPLAAACAALVTKHDMPGFGLTDRPGAGWAGWAGVSRRRGGGGSPDDAADTASGLEPYSLSFNGRLGSAILDLELAGAGGGKQGSPPPPPPPPVPAAAAASARAARRAAGEPARILVGHSLGAVCAAAEAVRDPGRVDGLVLIAPAIVAGGGRGKVPAPPSPSSPSALPASLAMWAAAVTAALLAAARLAAGLAARSAILLAAPLLVALLRAAVRSRAFWERGLAAAWGADGAPPAWLRDAYRAPQLVRGWERGLLRFVAARIPLGPGPWAAGAAALRAAAAEADADDASASPPSSAAARLAATVQASGLPVLIVHGSRDMLVPSANSLRLADQLRGDGSGGGGGAPAPVQVALLPRRGHTPHEEAPAEFVDVVSGFVNGVVSAAA